MKWFMRIWLLMFCGIPLIFLAIGAQQILSERRKINTYQPIKATVISSKVETRTSTDSDGNRSTSYEPVVTYTYSLDGKNYQCDDALPISGYSAGRFWARSIVKQFPSGKRTTAFFNPEDPNQAFLIKEYSYLPYVFVQFPLLFLMVGVTVGLAFRPPKRKLAPPKIDRGQQYRLRPKRSLFRRRLAAFVITGIWWGIGLATSGHYFLMAGNYETLGLIITPIYFAIGLIPMGMFIYYWLQGRTLSEPSVYTSVDRFTVGEPFEIDVKLPMRINTDINKLEVALVCDTHTRSRSGNKTSYASHESFKDAVTIMENEHTRADEVIGDRHTFTVPADKPATTIHSGYPAHEWSIQIELDIPGRPDYKGAFPIPVDPE